jgi:predicted CopG family antitoxin
VAEPERTSIQVRRDLLAQLEALKREQGAGSYEEVIRDLLRERRRLPRSYFGTLPKLKTFRREELDRLD